MLNFANKEGVTLYHGTVEMSDTEPNRMRVHNIRALNAPPGSSSGPYHGIWVPLFQKNKMKKKNPIFNAIIKVFNFEEDFVKYTNKMKSEEWTSYEIGADSVVGPCRAWINNKGNLIVQKPDERYFVLYTDIKGMESLEQYMQSHRGMNAYVGFDENFISNIPDLIHKLFASLNIRMPPEFTCDEFAMLAGKCSARSFNANEHLAGATAYCGQYIVVNCPNEFSWELNMRTEDGYKEYLPLVCSDKLGKFSIADELLHSLDKGYSDEFLWGGIPLDVQSALYKNGVRLD